MFDIEIVYQDRTERVAQWPDLSAAEAMAAHYRRECAADPGYVCVRVRTAGSKTPVLDSIVNLFDMKTGDDVSSD